MKETHSVGVRLSLGTAYSPAGFGIVIKMIDKVCFKKQYFKIKVGTYVSTELSTIPVFPSPFLISVFYYLPKHSPSAFHQVQPTQGRTSKGYFPSNSIRILTSQSHPSPPFEAHFLKPVSEWFSIPFIPFCPQAHHQYFSRHLVLDLYVPNHYPRVRSPLKTYPWRTMIGNKMLSSERI